MNEQAFADFDWSPLGEGFWLEAQKTTGATDQQTRFACCRHRGMTAVGSAKLAGYAGSDVAIRKAGSQAAKGTAVTNMMALAAAEAAGGDDGTVGVAEARRILSRLARGSDPNVRIKAVEGISKLDREERANRSPEPEADPQIVIDWVFGTFKFEYDLLQQQNALGWDEVFRRVVNYATSTAPSLHRGNGVRAPEKAGEVSADAVA